MAEPLKTERKWVFSWLDLIAPWGVSAVAVALCVWAVVSGKPPEGANPLVPKIISGVVGLVFAAMVPLWYFVRSKYRAYNYRTKHGIYVVLGKISKPERLVMEKWIDSVIEHWIEKSFIYKDVLHHLTEAEVRNALCDLTVFFLDTEKLSVWGRFVRGFSWGKDIAVGWRALRGGIEQQGTTDWVYVEKLTRHESSHPVLGYCGIGWDENEHHAIFAKTGLGA